MSYVSAVLRKAPWLMLLLCCVLTGDLKGQVPEYAVIIDPAVFDDLSSDETRELVAYLAYLVPPERWPTKPSTDEELSQFVQRTYGSAEHPELSAAIGLIVDLENELSLKPRENLYGETLRIPLLPRIPEDDVRPGWAQVASVQEVDLYSVRVGREKTEAARRRAENPDALAAGATWVIEADAPTLRQTEEFPGAARMVPVPRLLDDPRVYAGPVGQTVQISFPDSKGSPVAAGEPEPIDLSELEAASSYYLIDFFTGKNPCPHGKAVQEVVLHELARLKASHLADKVVPVDLNFYTDKEVSRRELQEFAAREYDGKAHRELLLQIEKLLRKKKGDEYEVPVLFLHALLSNILARDPAAVISMSFYIQNDIFRLLPKNFERRSDSVLLGAVLNLQGTVVENSERLEPIRTFYDQRHNRNVVLVGAWDENGKPFGMVSASGDGVTAAAPAFGYGQTGDCVWGRVGTSFATPSLGVRLFLARQLWRQHGVDISAESLRSRLALSGSLSIDLVSKYVSGGAVDLRRLGMSEGPFAVTHDGALVPLTGLSGYVEYETQGGVVRRPLAKSVDGFLGLQLVGDRVFIYAKNLGNWMEVSNVGLELELKGPKGSMKVDLLGFRENFAALGLM